MNEIIEIQIGGGHIVHSLEDACREYVKMIGSGESVRTKINFCIKDKEGNHKTITIRDEDDKTIAYGDFEGLQNFLEYAKEAKKDE